MIRISRCAEPPGLSTVRDERLGVARAAVAMTTEIRFMEYDIVKPELAAMQDNKCCYCEKREEQAKYRDVEHYRPKSVYWWLAWTWENLLFSCVDCNREHKRDRFPLSSGDRALMAEQAPPGDERPMVLDPSDPRSDPTTHIEFRRERIQGRERWTPYGTTARGWRTIEVCGLARPGLLTLYKAHVDELVRPRLERFEATLRQHEPQAVFGAWDSVRRGLLARERPFRALSHDALDALVPAAVRDRYRLELVRPGA
jgi:uncharacterized protein (TIGR02646 family)